MAVVAITLFLLCILSVYIWLRKHYNYWSERNVLCEKPLYFLGNMKGIGRLYNFRDIDERIYKKFKGKAPFVGFYSFLNRSAFVMDLELIKRIMVKDFSSFADRGLFHNVRDDPLTGNLLFLDGEQWRTLRHTMSPVFTTGKIRYMFPTMVEVSDRIVEAVVNMLQQNNSNIEVKDLCARYTTDVIGTCAFGIECNSLKDPSAEFRQMGKDIFEKPRHSLLVQAFMFSDPITARRLRLKNFTDDSAEFFMNAVRQNVEYREKNNIKRNDFMDMLIELKAQKDRQSDEINDGLSSGLTLEQVAAQALVFFLAGFDTTSTTMSFCLYELAMNPEIQTKLRNEINTVLEKHSGKLTYESIKEMQFLEMVISGKQTI